MSAKTPPGALRQNAKENPVAFTIGHHRAKHPGHQPAAGHFPPNAVAISMTGGHCGLIE